MLILDILLLIMTITCVVYCWMLNKRIHDLQNSRIEFARMIKELNASIVKAENNVNEMSELSKVTSTEIKTVVEEAKEVTIELMVTIEVASELVVNLGNQSKLASNFESSEQQNSYESNMRAKSGEKFSDEDLPPIEDKKDHASYTNHLKNFIQNIVTKKTEEDSSNLNQMSYYDTLRKINAKK